ncbi:hypothetical protein P9112_009703 [Eukaryota sp. TZLM1-RC]
MTLCDDLESIDIETVSSLFKSSYFNRDYDLSKALFWALKGAEFNDPCSLYISGSCQFMNGQLEEAFTKFNNASRSLHPKSIFMCALSLKNGLGVKLNTLRAFEKLHDATSLINDPLCFIALGECYRYGIGCPISHSKAKKCFERAGSNCSNYSNIFESTFDAAQNPNNFIEQYLLSLMLLHGLGCDKDPSTALSYLTKAAENGFSEALFDCGQWYLHGIAVNEDEETAMSYYKRAAEKGHPLAGFKRAELLEQDFDRLEESFRLYLTFAEKGLPQAMYKVALCYLHAYGTEVDHYEAFYWFQQACDVDFYPALVPLGKCLLNGIGCSRNTSQAKECFEKAVERYNNPEAMVQLGLLIKNDDEGKACELFKSAGEGGRSEGWMELGNYYWANEQSKDAFDCWKRAAEGGLYRAKEKALWYVKSFGNEEDIRFWEGQVSCHDHVPSSKCCVM